MTILTHQGAADFLDETESFLTAHEPENAVLLALAGRLRKEPEATSAIFLSVSDSGVCVLCALRPPGRNLTLSYDPCVPPEAVDRLARCLANLAPDLPGLSADPDTALAFSRRWTELTGRPASLQMDQTLFRLRSVISLPSAAGHLRIATAADLLTIAAWRHAFAKEALHSDDQQAPLALAQEQIAGGYLYIWEDGQPRCMAARTRPTRTTVSVSQVYTPPEWRKRGYATACVAALSRSLLATGFESCLLYTDNSNPVANAIYPRIGYMPIGRSSVYRFVQQ